MKKLYTRKEAAEILEISLPTLDAARKKGLIAFVQYKSGGCVYFTEQAVSEYIARCTNRAKPIHQNTTARRKSKDVRNHSAGIPQTSKSMMGRT